MRNGLHTETMRVYREQLAELKPGMMVFERSQRTGYKTVYTIRKLEGSQALVQRSSSGNAGARMILLENIAAAIGLLICSFMFGNAVGLAVLMVLP